MNIRFIATSIFCINIIISGISAVNKNFSSDCVTEKNTSDIALLQTIMTGTERDIKNVALDVVKQERMNQVHPILWTLELKKYHALGVLLKSGFQFDEQAIQWGAYNFDAAYVILKNGVNVNKYLKEYARQAVDFLGSCQLGEEIKAIEMLYELLKQGFDINDLWNFKTKADIYSCGLCYHYCRPQIKEAIDVLLPRGLDLNHVFTREYDDDIEKWSVQTTPLIFAIEFYHIHDVEYIKFLLDQGADVNLESFSPIMINHQECGRSWLCGKHTPLYFAVNNIHPNEEVTKLLIERGGKLH